MRLDESRRALRINEIQQSGHKVLVSTMVEGLTEEQAIRLEAELIAAFGTAETGGGCLPMLLSQLVSVERRGGRSWCRTVCVREPR